MVHPWGSLTHPMGDTRVEMAGGWHFWGVSPQWQSKFQELWGSLAKGSVVGWDGMWWNGMQWGRVGWTRHSGLLHLSAALPLER